jgi:hypothetical protein
MTKTQTPESGLTREQEMALGNLIADFAAAGLERFGSPEAFMAAMQAANRKA